MMAEKFSTLAEEIINYQKKNDMPDTAHLTCTYQLNASTT